MIPHDSQPSREDVLYAFAVEPTPGRDTLEQYLRDYPQYAAEIIDLSYELSRNVCEEETPLSAEDEVLLERAWRQHVNAAPKKTINPFATLSVAEQRELAQRLGVPRQVITAFREHRVTSVPAPFLERLAAAMNSKVEKLRDTFVLPSEPDLARSYKADDRPNLRKSVTFEQILIEANVSPEKRALLMTAENLDG